SQEVRRLVVHCAATLCRKVCRKAYRRLRPPVRASRGAPDQLANLDQVPVGVAHVTADPAAAADRRGQKLRSAGAPLLIDGGDVGDTDVQEARGVIWIRGRHERYGRLVLCGSPADADGDPAVRQGDDRELTLKHRLAAEHLSVETPGALDVPRYDEVGDCDPLCGRWEPCHLCTPA